MDRNPKELVGASTALLILGVLQREGSSYGYDIVRRVNQQAGGAFTWREGTVYPVLHKLERRRLVRATWQDAPHGRRRKYYALTVAGRASLNDGKRQWDLFHRLILNLSGASHAS